MSDPTEASHRVRFSLVVDAARRERFSGPFGTTDTPIELDVHIGCERAPDQEGCWRAWVGSAILKGALLRVPTGLGHAGRAAQKAVYGDPMAAAAGAYRGFLDFLWPGTER